MDCLQGQEGIYIYIYFFLRIHRRIEEYIWRIRTEPNLSQPHEKTYCKEEEKKIQATATPGGVTAIPYQYFMAEWVKKEKKNKIQILLNS